MQYVLINNETESIQLQKVFFKRGFTWNGRTSVVTELTIHGPRYIAWDAEYLFTYHTQAPQVREYKQVRFDDVVINFNSLPKLADRLYDIRRGLNFLEVNKCRPLESHLDRLKVELQTEHGMILMQVAEFLGLEPGDLANNLGNLTKVLGYLE